MEWDHLRYFLELARAGRLVIAARRLEVDHTTVSRRVQALEKQVGQALFLRTAEGYALTEAGRHLLPSAEAMENAYTAIKDLQPSVSGQLTGQVRVGATEAYGSLLLARHLAKLAQRYPHLKVDLLAMPRALQLSRNEADIVITLERPEKGPFVITRLTDYELRLYASPSYLAQHAPITDKEALKHHRFVTYVDDLLFSKELDFLAELVPASHGSWRSTSVLAQQEAVASGAGIAILPAFAAQDDARLVAVLPEQVSFTRTFWMLMPIELRGLARVRATWEFLREQVDRDQALLAGVAQ